VLDYIEVEKNNVDAINDINIDSNEAPVEIYTLDGRRVSGNANEHGIYIIRQGNKAHKVLK
jgi:hypothetical protein